MKSSRRVAFALAVLFSAALGAGALHAQAWAGKGRLQGEVKDPEGKPIAEARITLRWGKDPTQGPEPLLTDQRGKWSYLGVAGGKWTILIDAAGFKGAEGTAEANEFGPAPAIRVTMQRPSAEELQAVAEKGALGAVQRGNELMEAQKWAEARAEYQKALADLEPASQGPVLRGVARTYFQEGKKEEAIAELEKALAIAPDDADTLRLIISLLVAQGREKEAEKHIAKLPSGVGIDPNTLLNIGISRYNAGEYPQAVAEFDRVVADNPELPDAYYYRGLTHLAMGKNAEARADFEKLIALDPDGKLAGEAREFLESLPGGA